MDERQEQQQDAQELTAGGQAATTGMAPASIEATARELTPDNGGERDIFSNISDIKKRRFLGHLINTGGQVPRAAKLTGINRSTPYVWARDEVFAEAFEQAKEMAADVLEAEVIRRGAKGFKEPIIYQGKITGFVRRFSDNLLMFQLKKMRPAYRDNWTQQIGIMAGGKVQINFGIPRPDGPGETDNADG